MKLTTLFIFGFLIQVSATTLSQNKTMTHSFKNSTLEEVFETIEKESCYSIIYKNEIIRDLDSRFNGEFEDTPVSDILNLALKDEPIGYRMVDNVIVVLPKNKKSNLQDQVISISGKVIGSNGNPIPGVNVIENGTTNGTSTDINGQYVLKFIDANPSVRFSFIGYKEITMEVGDKTTINVVLEETSIGINEVIAVGYQSKSKKNLTGSVAVVDVKQLENRAAPRLTDLLKGAATGLIISQKDPGRIGSSDVSIRIGGLTTRGATDPLLVIDGIAQVNIDALNDINSDDIAKFSVLKDAEAAVYGSRAAGGVIVIETKSGNGKPKFTLGTNHQITRPRTYRKITNVLQVMEMYKEAHEYQDVSFFGFPDIYKYIEDNELTFDKIKNNDFEYVYGPGSAPFPDTPFMPFGHTDWMEELYGTAHATNYDFSASGSAGKINYFFSSSLKNEESMVKYGDNSSKSYYTRLKLDYKHSEKLTFGVNMSMKYQDLKEPTRYNDARDNAAKIYTWSHLRNSEGQFHSWSAANPASLLEEGGDRRSNYYKFNTQFYADYKILKNLTASAKIYRYANFSKVRSITKDFNVYKWDGRLAGTILGSGLNSTDVSNSVSSGYTGNFLLKYNIQIEEDHTIRALIGASHEEFRYDNVWAQRKRLISTNITTLNVGDSEEQYNSDEINDETLKSYFANLSYSYKDRYYIEGNYRNDGSSRFADGYKWKDFYSVSGAWNLTEESMIKNLDWKNLNFLKFRVSYAELGNQASIDQYDFVQQVNIATNKKDFGQVILGSPDSPTTAQFAWIDGFPAYTRTWEIAKKMNYGLDAKLFEDRLTIAANVFVTKNDNVFYNEEFPSVLGTSAPPINGASFKTNGWDLSVNWSDTFKNDFSYNIGFGISDANSTVTSLADTRIVKYGNNEYVEGYAPNTVFGFVFDGIIQNEEELAAYQGSVDRAPGSLTSRLYTGDARYKDLDGDGRIEGTLYEEDENGNPTESSGDIVELGSQEQHYLYFIKGGISWKNFDFSFVLDGVGKWMTFDETMKNYDKPWVQPYAHAYGSTWSPERTNAHYPRFSQIANDFSSHRNNNNYALSDAPYMRKDVPYLAIQNIQLGYKLPAGLLEGLGINSVYVYANGSNLGYLINKLPDGYVAEQPWTAALTPYPSTYTFGVNVNF